MYMKRRFTAYWIFLAAAFAGCDLQEGDNESMLIFSKDFDFNSEQHDWIPGFADYPAGPDDSAHFELRYSYTEPPTESILTKRAVMLSGNNLNRDLFMYLKRKITGLKPDTDYTITFSVELASNLNPDQYSTSEGSVYLKAGASASEPKSVIASGVHIVTIDKGNDDTAGEDVVNLGDIMTPEISTGYTLVSLNNTMANRRFVARTNSKGELWLIIGTDSNLAGTTSVYYTRINVVFSAS